MALQLRSHEFSVDDYHRMVWAGIFHEHERVELLDGEIIDMPPVGTRQTAAVSNLAECLGSAVVGRAALRVDTAIQTGGSSKVRPAVMVLRTKAEQDPESEAGTYPGPEDVLLLVEVTEDFDESARVKKLPHYARIGVPEVWLVDLKHERVERYAKPVKGRYQSIEPYHRGMSLTLSLLPGIKVGVDQVLP